LVAALEPELAGTDGTVPNVVLLVTHDGDPTPRRRVFIYRLRGSALEPRFLGSGPWQWLVGDVTTTADRRALRVVLTPKDRPQEHVPHICRLAGFPLMCEPTES
jgi:hypothetical protein